MTEQITIAAAGLIAVSQHDGKHDSPAEAVAAAQAVSISRGALYQCLIDLGWAPPRGVAEGMRLDQLLLREGLGACYDGVTGSHGPPAASVLADIGAVFRASLAAHSTGLEVVGRYKA